MVKSNEHSIVERIDNLLRECNTNEGFLCDLRAIAACKRELPRRVDLREWFQVGPYPDCIKQVAGAVAVWELRGQVLGDSVR